MRGLAGREGMPRQWAYGASYNVAQRPRGTEQTSFEQLRNLAALYDGVQLCERVYFDVIGRLELRVLPRTDALEAMRSTLSVWTADGFPADHADSMRAIELIEAELREAEA